MRQIPWLRSIACLLGLTWTTFAVRDVLRARAAVVWPTAPGAVHGVSLRTIDEYSASRTGRFYRTTYYTGATLEYTFEVRGSQWYGWRENITDPAPHAFRFRPRVWLDHPNPQGTARRFAAGRVVSVRYNPADPRDAALDVSTPLATWIELTAGIFLLATGIPLRLPRPSPRAEAIPAS